MNTELAANILAAGKRLAPDRFPQPGPDTAREWAAALGEVDLPVEMWPEAVRLWSTELVGDRMCTPRELIQAVKTVRVRWESDPSKRERLEAHRLARLNANYARMGLEAVDRSALSDHTKTAGKPLTQRIRQQSEGPQRMGEVHTFNRRQK